ncbi:MAG TPA: oligosaccharide flippase family protein [Blastocatellia bacterium]|nr:oligosaccharide flippase family protein [Blastocatellia bacterium]
MKAILRATAILSTSSIVTILTTLVATKVYAVLLGPGGLGFLGLLQSLVSLSSLIAGMGIGAGLVRRGANALGREDQTEVTHLRQAAWFLFWLLGCLAVTALVVFRAPVSRWMLGGPEHAGSVVLMGLALVFSLASGIQTSILNAYHRVGALARLGIFNSICGTGLSLTLVWFWREQAVPVTVIASTGVGWIVSRYFLRRETGQGPRLLISREVLGTASSLLRFGAPYTASMLVGTGVQLALPILVLHRLGKESVGFYQAAAMVSIGYLSFLLTAMAQDYYPRLSAAGDQADTLVHLVNQQQRFVMAVGVPIILGVLALARYIVPLVYSPQFYPAVELLEWQLTGDLLKLLNWTLGFVILARSGSSMFFLIELTGGATTILASWWGMNWFGLTGLGVGFLATSVAYYLAAWIIARREIGLRWTTDNKRIALASLLAAVVIRALPFIGLESLRTPTALSFALLACLNSMYMAWKDMGGMRDANAS